MYIQLSKRLPFQTLNWFVRKIKLKSFRPITVNSKTIIGFLRRLKEKSLI